MGRVSLEYEANITEVLENQGASDYTAAQGFTVAPSGVSFAVLLNKKVTPNKGALMCIAGSNRYIRTDMDFGHGNDCAYYDGYVYVTVGGEGADRKQVKRYELNTGTANNWLDAGVFTYIPMSSHKIQTDLLDRVSAIDYVSGNHFILIEGKKFSVCCLDEANQQFVEISRFEINDADYKKLSRSNCTRRPQGICYMKNKLYKVFSYEDDTSGKIKKNDIAAFHLQGTSPSFTGISLNTKYSCDRTSLVTFEVEGIGSPNDGGRMYLSANVRGEGTDKQSDAVYKVTLEN